MVTFAVGYRNAQSNFLRKVTDTGTFTPGTPVAHHFDLYNDVTYSGKQVHGCSAVAVKFADGSKWSIWSVGLVSAGLRVHSPGDRSKKTSVFFSTYPFFQNV